MTPKFLAWATKWNVMLIIERQIQLGAKKFDWYRFGHVALDLQDEAFK